LSAEGLEVSGAAVGEFAGDVAGGDVAGEVVPPHADNANVVAIVNAKMAASIFLLFISFLLNDTYIS